MKRFYINVQGGTGLNIALASFISKVKEENPDKYEFYVCSPYFDIFESCEAVDDVYKPQELKDLIFDAEANNGELVLHRLYDMDGFVKKQLNYSEAWAKLMNIPWKEDDEKVPGTKATSILNPMKKYPHLQNSINTVMNTIREKGFEDFVIMQFWGGQSPLVQVPQGVGKDGKPFADWSKVPYTNIDNEPLKRVYPIEKATEFVKQFREAHPKTAVILYSLPNEPGIDGTFKFVIPYLAYYELAKRPECKGTVSIDSSLAHLVAGITKSVVIWGHSKPKSFGYSYNKNIEQKCRTDDLLYFSALGPSGAKITYIEPEALLAEVTNYLELGEKKDENTESPAN